MSDNKVAEQTLNDIYDEYFPKEWKVAKLGSVITNEKQTIDPGKAPEEMFEYYSIPAYQNNKKSVAEIGKNIRSQKLLTSKDTVLFGKLNPRVPKIWLVDTSSELRQIASTEFIPLQPLQSLIDIKYLYYLCWSDYILPKSQELVSGSTPSRQRVDHKSFKNIRVPLPSLSEQHNIAHILSTIQQAIEAIDKVIIAAQKLKSSLMQHLFTYGPVSLEEAEQIPLKETEIGMIPEHWELVNLGEITNVKGGKRLPKGHAFSDIPTSYPYLRVVDFKNQSININSLKYLTYQDYEAIKNYTISSNDIYISIAGTIGLVGLIPKQLDGANLTENAAKIVIQNSMKTNQYFLMAFLASTIGQQQIQSLSTKTSQPKLALTRIKQITVTLPPLSEQKEVSNVLQKVILKIEREESKKYTLQFLFNSMLYNLMTGKLRVNDLDLNIPEEVAQ